MAVHKKQEKQKPQESSEPVIVSDVVTETTETIEVIEDVTPQAAKSETPAEPTPPENPLSEFKEKMVEEELSAPSDAPKKNYMWPILFIFIAAILLLTGVFLYRQGKSTDDKVNVVKLSPAPSVTPQPTKVIDLTKYEIEILNGGGVSGEAGRQKTSLETAGFTISSIGNADNSDYTDTIIQTKKEVDEDFIKKLKDVLNSSFTVGEIESLSEDASVPVVVIIGTKN